MKKLFSLISATFFIGISTKTEPQSVSLPLEIKVNVESIMPLSVCSSDSILAEPPAAAILFEEDKRYQTLINNIDYWSHFKLQDFEEHLKTSQQMQKRTATTPEEWKALGADLKGMGLNEPLPVERITEQQALERMIMNAKICAQLETEVVLLRAIYQNYTPNISLPDSKRIDSFSVSQQMQKRTAATPEEWKALGAGPLIIPQNYSAGPYRELSIAAYFFEGMCENAMPSSPSMEFNIALTIASEGGKFILKRIPHVGLFIEAADFVISYNAERYNKIWDAAYLEEKQHLSKDEAYRSKIAYVTNSLIGSASSGIVSTTVKYAFEKQPKFLTSGDFAEGITGALGKEIAKQLISRIEYQNAIAQMSEEINSRIIELSSLHLVTIPAIPYLCDCADKTADKIEERRRILEKMVEIGVRRVDSLGFTATHNWFALNIQDPLCNEDIPECAMPTKEFIETIRKTFFHQLGLWSSIGGYGGEFGETHVRLTRDSALTALVFAQYGNLSEALKTSNAFLKYVPHKEGLYADNIFRRSGLLGIQLGAPTGIYLLDNTLVTLTSQYLGLEVRDDVMRIEYAFPLDEGMRTPLGGGNFLSGNQGEAEFIISNLYLSRIYARMGNTNKSKEFIRASREAQEDLELVVDQMDMFEYDLKKRISTDPILNAAFAAAYCDSGNYAKGKKLLHIITNAKKEENNLYKTTPVWYPFRTYDLFPQSIIADAFLTCNCPYSQKHDGRNLHENKN